MSRLVGALLLLALSTACSATRVVRLDSGHGDPIIHVPSADEADPVELEEEEFTEAVAEEARGVRLAARPLEAARQLFGVPERSGWYRYEGRSQRMLPAGAENHLTLELSRADLELKHQYLLWCGRTWGRGDCLRLMVDSPMLDSDGRYTLAMAIAQRSVLGEMRQAFGAMVDPQSVGATIASAVTMYMVLWALPEPVSKGVAATLTVALIAYLGVDTVWQLIDGWFVLMKEVDQATTFEEIHAAGERYGKVMGQSAARAFALLAMVAMGNTVGMAARLPSLPGAGQAAVTAEAQLGIRYAAAGQVRTVALTAEGFAVRLPAGAMNMAARGRSAAGAASASFNGYRAWKSFSGFKKAMGKAGPGKQWHHVVEQTPGNVNRFGREALHNIKNITAVETGAHKEVSRLYSSIRPDITNSRTLTVRQWLGTQSYEAQREFGLRALENVMKGVWP